jgi:O-antigen/teichoic acid export membrane protein
MQQIRKAFLVATVGQYYRIIINLILIAVVSRLLGPTEIGIAVLGLGITTVVISFREFVTSDYLIQLPVVERVDVRTAMTVTFAITLVLALLLNLTSWRVAEFYNQPSLPAFIMLVSVSAIFNSMTQPNLALLKRDMQFGRATIVDATAATVTSATIVFCALWGWSAMSFAIGAVAGSGAAFLVAQLIHPTWWSFGPSLRSFPALFEFGRYRGGTTMLDRAYDSLPAMVLGSVMPSAAVGIYNRAVLTSSLPDKMILSAVFSIAFPAVSAGVRAGANVKISYLHALSLITTVYWPTLLVMAILVDPIVRLVLGQAWGDVTPIARILLVTSVFWFPVVLTAPLLLALGANKSAFIFNTVSKLISALFLFIASFFGLYAIALSQFICIPLQMLFAFVFVMKHMPVGWGEIFLSVRANLVITALAIAGPLVLGFHTNFQFDQSIGDIIMAIILSAAGFVIGLWVIQPPLLGEILALMGKNARQTMPAPLATAE